jgi:hypothetical protein
MISCTECRKDPDLLMYPMPSFLLALPQVREAREAYWMSCNSLESSKFRHFFMTYLSVTKPCLFFLCFSDSVKSNSYIFLFKRNSCCWLYLIAFLFLLFECLYLFLLFSLDVGGNFSLSTDRNHCNIPIDVSQTQSSVFINTPNFSWTFSSEFSV